MVHQPDFRIQCAFRSLPSGKDRHPFPVQLKTYDESLAVLRRSLDAAKLGDTEKIDGFKRLDRMVRAVEQRRQPIADLDRVVQHEHAISPSPEGRPVFDDRKKKRPTPTTTQLSLFVPSAFGNSGITKDGK